MKYRNQLIFVLTDAALSIAAISLAVWLRFEGLIPPDYRVHLLRYYPIAAVVVVLAGMAFGTYRSVLQYMGFADAFRQLAATGTTATIFLIIKYSGLYTVSGSITVVYFGILFMMATSVRLVPRFRYWLASRRQSEARRTMIIGAGTTGAMVIKRLEENTDEGLLPVVAVDDDPEKAHMRVAGVMVAARLSQIPRVVKKYNIEEAILAIPSLDTAKITEVYRQCISCGVKLRLFRSAVDMESFFAGNQKALAQIAVEDLLFRDSITLDKELIFRCLYNKTVLVTGGAGSIGREICRQALSGGCGKLIVLDMDENGLFAVDEEFKDLYPPEKYELCLGTIRDEDYLAHVFRSWQPELVFHAAAHKHVPMVEANPAEAVKNNIAGTENVLVACQRYGVERFILISSDKAVNPANIMGATKRIAELLTQSKNTPGCKMAAVRFGNVLASAGSVIPTFRKQIEAGGPVTVTHQDMERYFITIQEAVSLVMIAGTLAEGGEIFVLDMGKPVKIYDLAKELIRLSGYEPEKDIKIAFTGVRPGEKMFEEIVLDSEKVSRTAQEQIFIMKSGEIDTEALMGKLAQIKAAAHAFDEAALKAVLMETVGQFS